MCLTSHRNPNRNWLFFVHSMYFLLFFFGFFSKFSSSTARVGCNSHEHFKDSSPKTGPVGAMPSHSLRQTGHRWIVSVPSGFTGEANGDKEHQTIGSLIKLLDIWGISWSTQHINPPGSIRWRVEGLCSKVPTMVTPGQGYSF